MDHVESTDQTEMDPPPRKDLTPTLLRERLGAERLWIHHLSRTAEYLGEAEAAMWLRLTANLLNNATDAIDSTETSK